jgi:Ca2+-transporting ATPase
MKKISLKKLNFIKLNPLGLTSEEVYSQREKFGANNIFENGQKVWIELFKDTLKDPMIWFLVVIGLIFYFLGEVQESVTLLLAIIPLFFMDAFLHFRTQKSTMSLKSRLSSDCIVIREGKKQVIKSENLVPGDLMVLAAGDILSADGFFEEVSQLKIDESALTGEAFPLSKSQLIFSLNSFDENKVLSLENTFLGLAGTRVLSGKGLMRVIETGIHTSYGEIIHAVTSMPSERTQLQVAIARMVQYLIYGAIFFCVLLFLIRIFQGYSWLDAFLSSATLAIATVPEEFPVVFTFFLGVGVYRLARKNALVRRAVSVENIGRINHICSDKTGTITTGVLTLTHLHSFGTEDDLLKTAFFATNPDLSDPVDEAIRSYEKANHLIRPSHVHIYPFSEDKKCEVVIMKEDHHFVAYAKGAPSTILSKTSFSDEQEKIWIDLATSQAKEGHKVIACAKKILPILDLNSLNEPVGGFEFSGLLSFEDPPRPEIRGAVDYCHAHQIKILMLTGDHPETARAIAREVGIGQTEPRVISAEENEHFFEDEAIFNAGEKLMDFDVVARCTPLQKFKIVNALKRFGRIVAVTGDGVNDVPALKAADIGIAMGERGTRSAKEVSSIILLDDNFKTITNAIIEGKLLFQNLKKSFEYLFLIHIPFALTAALIPLLGYPLLYLPSHVVLLELMIHPTMLLAFQLDDFSEINEENNFQLFKKSDFVKYLIIGVLVSLVVSLVFIHSVKYEFSIIHARSKALSLLSLWNAALVIFITKGVNKTSNILIVILLMFTFVIIQIRPISQLIHLGPLHLMDWFLNVMFVGGLLTVFYFLKKYSRN